MSTFGTGTSKKILPRIFRCIPRTISRTLWNIYRTIVALMSKNFRTIFEQFSNNFRTIFAQYSHDIRCTFVAMFELVRNSAKLLTGSSIKMTRCANSIWCEIVRKNAIIGHVPLLKHRFQNLSLGFKL